MLHVVPVAIAGLVLAPFGGTYSEGVFMEGLATLAGFGDDPAEFVDMSRLVFGAVAFLGIVAGAGFCLAIVLRWRKKLLGLGPEIYTGLRPLVWKLFLFAAVVGLLAGLLVGLLSRIRGGGPVVVLITAIWGCLIASIQFWCSTFGANGSRRLWRGR